MSTSCFSSTFFAKTTGISPNSKAVAKAIPIPEASIVNILLILVSL